MTGPRKLLLGSAFAIATGICIYGTWQASVTRDEIRTLNAAQTRLHDHSRQLRHARDESLSQIEAQQQENQRMTHEHADLLKSRDDPPPAFAAPPESANNDSIANTWPSRVTQLKECLILNPESRIPEMQLLDDGDWLAVVMNRATQTESDDRRALSALRSLAEGKFGRSIQKALRTFQKDNDRRFPADLATLQPYFDVQPDPAMLARWTIVPAETIPNVRLGGDFLVTQMSGLVDYEIDDIQLFGSNGVSSTTYEAMEIDRVMEPVWNAYRKAHGGTRDPLDPKTALQPYVITAEQKAAFQKMLKRYSQ